MFGAKAKNKDSNGDLANNEHQLAGAVTCVVAKGTTIEGTFYTPEDVRMDGVLIGDLVSDKRLVMGDQGHIKGTANCYGSSVKGKIDGELSVDGTLHLSETAYVDGKIKARKLVVDEGASYTGECLIGEKHFKK